MATLVVCIVLLGFYFSYHTSEKASPPRSLAIERWIFKNRSLANVIGVTLQIVAAAMSAVIWGFGSGILFYFIILMTVSSLVIMLGPAKIVGYKTVFAIAALFLIIELTI